MFTGLISDVGVILAVTTGEVKGGRVVMGCSYDCDSLAIGASVACSGICLSLVAKGGASDLPKAVSPESINHDSARECWFAVDVSAETRARTAADMWQVGRKINLERPLKVGDELGGHIVTGHIDGVGTIRIITADGECRQITIAAPLELAAMIAAKGSIAVDGIALTVNAVGDEVGDEVGGAGAVLFSATIIPHTQAMTTLGTACEGQAVNLEIDILARYLHRMTTSLKLPA